MIVDAPAPVRRRLSVPFLLRANATFRSASMGNRWRKRAPTVMASTPFVVIARVPPNHVANGT